MMEVTVEADVYIGSDSSVLISRIRVPLIGRFNRYQVDLTGNRRAKQVD
jgi:hypothetical protein